MSSWIRNYRQPPGKPEYLVSPGPIQTLRISQLGRWVPINFFPQGHIQVLHCHLHTIYICLHGMYHLYWIIFTVKLYYCCPEDGHFMNLFHSLFLPTSQYHQPRRYFMPEMNHGTKGDYVARNSINDRSVTWRERGSCFMFKLLSPTRGSNQP